MSRKSGTGRGGGLPELELECIKVLWDNGPLTVRGIREGLLPRRPLAYTTVLTVLDRLARKGIVTRYKRGRAHVYDAVYSRAAACEAALARLLEHYFGGSRELLLEHLMPGPGAAVPAGTPAAAVQEAGALDTALL
jgi:BlaI family penicillinase repressor